MAMQPKLLIQVLTRIAACVNAGLPWHAAVTGMAGADLDAATRAAFEEDAREGTPLSASLSRLGIIDDVDAALLVAGERTGHFDAAVADLVASANRRIQQRRALTSLLAYPAFLVIFALLVLPLPLAFTCGPGAWAARALPPVMILVGTAIGWTFVWPRLPASSPVRRWVATVAAYTPLVASAVEAASRARFTGLLARAVDAGLGLREALTLASRGVGPGFSLPLPSRLVAVAERSGLAGALAETRLFGPHELAIIANAEQTGRVVDALKQLEAESWERSVARTKTTIAALGAIVFAVVTVAIGISIVRGFAQVLDTVDQAIESQTR